MPTHQASVKPVHTLEVGFGVVFKKSEPGVPPAATKVDSQAALARQSVADPIGAAAVFHDDYESARLLKVADGDAMPLSRAPSYGLDDQCVAPRIGRPRDPQPEGPHRHEVGD